MITTASPTRLSGLETLPLMYVWALTRAFILPTMMPDLYSVQRARPI